MSSDPLPSSRPRPVYAFFVRTSLLTGLAGILVSPLPAQAGDTGATGQTPRFAQNGRKNRIVFDQDPSAPVLTASPSPTSTPSPTFKVEPTPDVPAPTPVPTPTPAASPSPAGESSRPAAVSATPTPEEFKPLSTPTPAPLPAPTPTPVAAAPTPAPAASSSPAVAAAPSPAPTAPPAADSTPAKTVAGKVPVDRATAQSDGDVLAVEEPMPTRADETASIDVVANAANADLAPPLGGVDRSLPTPTDSVTINLINKLVQRGVITKDDAADMVKQAQAEAQVVREQMQADMFAIAQAAAVQAATEQIAIAGAGSKPSADDVSVTYIPAPVRMQIKEDIKSELLAESKAGTFRMGPQPYVPAWVARFRPTVDFRFRYESDTFPDGNSDDGSFPNFNAINTGAPFDVTGNEFAPQFNTTQDRNRFRIRIRLGAELDINDNVTAGVRLATGENNSPVTTNQTVGLANQGQGGNFSKYAIWLDRAFVRFDVGEDPNKNLALTFGRFDNPFFSTPLIFDDDLGFDGVALNARYEIFRGVTPFITAGAFPVFNTDFNYSSNQPQKFASYDKYLFGGQAGLDVKVEKLINIKVAVAYYYFYNVEGKLSSPYTPLSPDDASDTDNSRPSFAQKGNTYFPIRNIVPDASNDYGAINQWQYYGLATPFEELAVTARIDFNAFEPVQVSLIGEY
ncbi:MAG: putative porin, partial [Terrimicrobiaceae bacterium]